VMFCGVGFFGPPPPPPFSIPNVQRCLLICIINMALQQLSSDVWDIYVYHRSNLRFQILGCSEFSNKLSMWFCWSVDRPLAFTWFVVHVGDEFGIGTSELSNRYLYWTH
jgi:hypothetical protein